MSLHTCPFYLLLLKWNCSIMWMNINITLLTSSVVRKRILIKSTYDFQIKFRTLVKQGNRFTIISAIK